MTLLKLLFLAEGLIQRFPATFQVLESSKILCGNSSAYVDSFESLPSTALSSVSLFFFCLFFAFLFFFLLVREKKPFASFIYFNSETFYCIHNLPQTNRKKREARGKKLLMSVATWILFLFNFSKVVTQINCTRICLRFRSMDGLWSLFSVFFFFFLFFFYFILTFHNIFHLNFVCSFIFFLFFLSQASLRRR